MSVVDVIAAGCFFCWSGFGDDDVDGVVGGVSLFSPFCIVTRCAHHHHHPHIVHLASTYV